MKKKTMCVQGIILALGLIFANQLSARQAETPYLHIPSTVSQEAQEFLQVLPDPNLIPAFPASTESDQWKSLQTALEAHNIEKQQALLERLQPTITEMDFGGVPVLDVKPKGWKDNGKVLVYTHQGAYVLESASSTLASSALMADRTGVRVISIDYTLAPHAQWQEITDQVITVFDELKKAGYSMKDIAILGDSAGGGLAAGSVLKMRDQGMGMPAAVVLWSPWADITETGDSYVTLKHAEPMYIYQKHLKPAADAYAEPKDQKNPYVSPVYGDYSKGFPPTLIQGGTKEIFLSNFIRLYQALDTAGQTVKLDLYEGMLHIFQSQIPDSSEAKIAFKKVDEFLRQNLVK